MLHQPPISSKRSLIFLSTILLSGCVSFSKDGGFMGMMVLWITHPKDINFMKVDRDFCFLLNSYDIEPGSFTPKVNTMLDFNLWTWNSRVFPGIDPLVCRLGDKVRIRIGNLSMCRYL